MATQMFLRDSRTFAGLRGAVDASISGGGNQGFAIRDLLTTRGAAAVTSPNVGTLAGPTSGQEITFTSSGGATFGEFISPPLAAGATISGTVTFNIRMSENSMSANVGPQVIIERLNSTMGVVSTVINSEHGTETGTTETLHNWTGTPTSTTFAKGDRIRVRVCGNDAGGNMAAGFTYAAYYNGPTAAASGDAYVTFNENLTFQTTDPTGTTLYPTTTAITDITADDDREMWTSRGSGTSSATGTSATGPMTPSQFQISGTNVSWFTRGLTAFTLAGLVKINVRGSEDTAAANASIRAELAIVDNDGTNAVTWAASGIAAEELTTSEAAYTIYLAGADTAVANNQRLRIRFFVDDAQLNATNLHSITLNYAGTSGGASGDTFLTLEQTVTEFVPGGAPPPPRKDRRIVPNLDFDPWSGTGWLTP